jgi:hypothetical protein
VSYEDEPPTKRLAFSPNVVASTSGRRKPSHTETGRPKPGHPESGRRKPGHPETGRHKPGHPETGGVMQRSDMELEQSSLVKYSSALATPSTSAGTASADEYFMKHQAIQNMANKSAQFLRLLEAKKKIEVRIAKAQTDLDLARQLCHQNKC